MQGCLIYLFLQTLYVFQAVPPPIIRSTQLYIQLQVLPINTAVCWCRGWGGLLVGLNPTSRQVATRTGWIITVSHKYSNFLLMMAHRCSKHVEKKHKYIKQNCATSWIICARTTDLSYWWAESRGKYFNVRWGKQKKAGKNCGFS